MSFSMAIQRIGGRVLDWNISQSSQIKGESPLETLRSIEAMEPDLIIVRHDGEDSGLNDGVSQLSIPVINGGSGVAEHPTQALLDLFTLIQAFKGGVEGRKILFVGDVKHSRVASSNLHLMNLFGAEISICCPDFMKPTGEKWKGVKYFSDLKEALSQADAVMGLRAQLERHKGQSFSEEEYMASYQLNPDKMAFLGADSWFMHPGPHRPLDLDEKLLNDPRCLIREQVKNGVYIRASLLSLVLEDLGVS